MYQCSLISFLRHIIMGYYDLVFSVLHYIAERDNGLSARTLGVRSLSVLYRISC